MNRKIPVFILLGPTASGKTALLFWLFNGILPFEAEVIAADSMQVYKGLNTGTAKPSFEERSVLPHHLVDVAEPDAQFNAGTFVAQADPLCAAIYSKEKLPVISGGSGFYIKNFVNGLPDTPAGSEEIRHQLKKEAVQRGTEALFSELQNNDSESAARINAGDTYRIIRALTVLRQTGKPLSAFEMESAQKKEARKQKYDFLIIGISRKRGELYERINERVSLFFENGLAEEVKYLFEVKKYTPSCPGLAAIGYKEFFTKDDEGNYKLLDDIESVKEKIKQNSRRYAKRQETFFKTIDGVKWFTFDENEKSTKQKIAAEVNSFWDKYHA